MVERTYHLERLLRAQQVEHGLEVLVDVAGGCGGGGGGQGAALPPVPRAAPRPAARQNHRRAFARKVALAEAATIQQIHLLIRRKLYLQMFKQHLLI